MTTSKFAIAIASAVVVAAAIIVAVLVLRPAPKDTPAAAVATSATPAPPAAAPAARQRVADLMAKAGCKGDVIGTQLYSYETGRCAYDGSEVTIAVFDTDQLRDQWVAAARGFGGTYVVGQGWAARVEKPDPAKTLAGKLNGTMA